MRKGEKGRERERMRENERVRCTSINAYTAHPRPCAKAVDHVCTRMVSYHLHIFLSMYIYIHTFIDIDKVIDR